MGRNRRCDLIDKRRPTCVGCRLTWTDKSGGMSTVLEHDTRHVLIKMSCACVRAHLYVCVCVRACVRACVCVLCNLCDILCWSGGGGELKRKGERERNLFINMAFVLVVVLV